MTSRCPSDWSSLINGLASRQPVVEEKVTPWPTFNQHPIRAGGVAAKIMKVMPVGELMSAEEIAAASEQSLGTVQGVLAHHAKQGWVDFAGRPRAYMRNV